MSRPFHVTPAEFEKITGTKKSLAKAKTPKPKVEPLAVHTLAIEVLYHLRRLSLADQRRVLRAVDKLIAPNRRANAKGEDNPNGEGSAT